MSAFDFLIDDVSVAVADADQVVTGFGNACEGIMINWTEVITDWYGEQAYNLANPTDQVDSGLLDEVFDDLRYAFDEAQGDIEYHIGSYGVAASQIEVELDYAGRSACEIFSFQEVYDEWVTAR